MLKKFLNTIIVATCVMSAHASDGDVQRGAYHGPSRARPSAGVTASSSPLRIKGGPEIWGVIEYSSEWDALDENSRPYGMYSFKASNPSDFRMLANMNENMPNGGGIVIDGLFHYITYTVMYETQVVTYYRRRNTETWQEEGYAQYQYGTTVATDLAWDSETEAAYGYYYSPVDMNRPMELCKVTYGEYGPSILTVAQEENDMVAVAIDAAGQLYGIDSEGGFYRVDKNTGARELVDYTGVQCSTFRQSAAYDTKSGKIYWAAFTVTDEGPSSALYEIEPSTGVATKVADIPNAIEFTCLHIPAPLADDDAPAAVTGLETVFPAGALEGSVDFVLPAETYGGDALTGNLDYTVYVNDAQVATGNGEAGSRQSVPLTVQAGDCAVYVVVSNATGAGPKSETVRFFAGYDTPVMPTDLVLTVDDEGNAALSWTAPAETVNGGYLDVDGLTYDVVRYPGAVAVATGLKATSFTEKLAADRMAAYSYGVIAEQHGLRSEEAQSEKVVIGEAFDVPFIDDFSTEDLYALYSVVTPTEGSPSWSPSNQSFVIFYGWNPSDSWLMTPPVRLQAGKSYKFEYDLRSAGTYDMERFGTAYGIGEDPATFTTLREAQDFKSTDGNYTHFTETLVAEADGIYRFGIHACSDGFKSGFYVTNISVRSDEAPDVPAMVSDLNVTAAEGGELKVNISLRTPSNDVNGNPLESLTKVEVTRGDGAVVASIDNPAAGAVVELVDENPSAGNNDYKICAYNEIGRGEVSEASVWAGVDVPAAPTEITITELENGVSLSWTAPTEGTHGGWIDADALSYNIYDGQGEAVSYGVTGTETQLTFDTSRPNVLYFAVSAVSEAGEGDQANTEDFVIGRPATLPLIESFAGGSAAYGNIWWTRGKLNFNHFNFSPYFACDNDWGSAYWFPLQENDEAWLNTGRVTASGSTRPMLMFSYYSTPGESLGIEAVADIEQNNPVSLFSASCAEDTGEAGWRNVAVELPDEVKDASWFVLRFHATGDHDVSDESFDHAYMYVDNVRLIEVPEADASVSLMAPSVALTGQTYRAEVTVSNHGATEIEKAEVELLVDGESVATGTVSAIPFDDKKTVSIEYVPGLFDNPNVEVSARVSLDGDAVPGNDESQTLAVEIKSPSFTAVNDLRCELIDGAQTLVWSDPTLRPYKVEESFDAYNPWQTESAGGWRMFDGDGVETNVYTSMYYPHIGEKLSFMVFNPDYASMTGEQREIFTPLSGNQCMVAVANLHEYGKGIECEDWLISPELSGDAQTIEFMSKTLTDYEEDFAIYASSSDNEVETLRLNRVAFEKFGSGNQWRRHTYQLPEETRYFAIVYTSNLSGLMIDDVRYEGARLELTGYNVYRDNELFATVAADATTCRVAVPADESEETHEYAVTAVYAPGESGLSNAVYVKESGVSSLLDDAREYPVFTVTGISLGLRDLKSLDPGVYVVNGRKVIVK